MRKIPNVFIACLLVVSFLLQDMAFVAAATRGAGAARAPTSAAAPAQAAPAATQTRGQVQRGQPTQQAQPVQVAAPIQAAQPAQAVPPTPQQAQPTQTAQPASAPAPAQAPPAAPTSPPQSTPAPAAPVQAPPPPNVARAATANVVATAAPRVMASTADNNIEEDPCRAAFWGCMDQFCMSDNEHGGRCLCSNDNIRLAREYEEAMTEVENEMRRLGALEEQLEFGETTRINRTNRVGVSTECANSNDIACQVGAMKFNAAARLCDAQVTAECRGNHAFIRLQYSQNIRNDCGAFQRAIGEMRERGARALAEARVEMRRTATEQLETRNRLGESECRVELRACMNTADVCGTDWARCTADNIQERRFHCERILDQCQLIREQVWSGFVAEITPTLTRFALQTESQRRQSCLGRISECLVSACRDDIEGRGTDTMDACLAHPEMARSFCRVQLEECDPNGNYWGFISAKLAAMRVDRCTEEVRSCIKADTACGPDFGRCLGLDMPALHRMCPLDSLVVCRQGRPDFSLDDLDDMLMGMFLQIDNQQLDDCQEAIFARMEEICGAATGCRRFLGPNVGASSLRYVRSDGNHIITGIVNWGNIRVSGGGEWSNCVSNNGRNCERFPQAGTLMLDEYIGHMRDEEIGSQDVLRRYIDGSNSAAEEEMRSVVGEINRMVSMLEADQRIGWCIHGRDMSQVTGNRGETTQARFPTLTQMQRRIIAEAALGMAVENHNIRLQELMRQAQDGLDAAAAEYMCFTKPTMVVGRQVPESEEDRVSAGSYKSTRIIGRAASRAEIEALRGRHDTRIDSLLTKTIWVEYYAPATRACRICVIDTFRGQRRFVDPRAGEAEALREAIKEMEREIAAGNRASNIALGATAGVAAAALTGVAISGAIAATTAFAATAVTTAVVTTVAGTAIATTTVAVGGVVAGTATVGATAAAGGAATAIGAATGIAGGAATAGMGAGAAAGVGTAVAGGTSGAAAAAGAGAAIFPVGTIIVAAVIVTAVIGFGIFRATRRTPDPMKQVVTRTVEYCFTDFIGGEQALSDIQEGADTIRDITSHEEAEAAGATIQ